MPAVLRERNFALFWTGNLISATGNWMLFVGLPIYIFTLTHSVLATSATFLANQIPQILVSSVAGVFVDRWNRQRVAVATNVLLAVSLAPLLFIHSATGVWIVYTVADGVFCLVLFNYSAGSWGILPAVICFLLIGIANIGFFVQLTTLLQTQTPDAYRGRIFGAYSMVWALFLLLGTGLTGALGDRLGIIVLLNVEAILFFPAGALAFVFFRNAAAPAVASEPDKHGDEVPVALP
jgi:MFS family permease